MRSRGDRNYSEWILSYALWQTAPTDPRSHLARAEPACHEGRLDEEPEDRLRAALTLCFGVASHLKCNAGGVRSSRRSTEWHVKGLPGMPEIAPRVHQRKRSAFRISRWRSRSRRAPAFGINRLAELTPALWPGRSPARPPINPF